MPTATAAVHRAVLHCQYSYTGRAISRSSTAKERVELVQGTGVRSFFPALDFFPRVATGKVWSVKYRIKLLLLLLSLLLLLLLFCRLPWSRAFRIFSRVRTFFCFQHLFSYHTTLRCREKKNESWKHTNRSHHHPSAIFTLFEVRTCCIHSVMQRPCRLNEAQLGHDALVSRPRAAACDGRCTSVVCVCVCVFFIIPFGVYLTTCSAYYSSHIYI